MDGIVGKTYQTYYSLPPCHEIDILCHKLSQNDDFVSKYPSSVAAILKPRFWDHVTPIFQPALILDPVWRSQTTPMLRLPPELLRMRTVKDIKVNAFVFVYRSHTYPPCLRWEHLSVHRNLFGLSYEMKIFRMQVV